MQNIITKLKKYGHYFKAIFIVSVLVIIVVELGNLSKTIDFTTLSRLMKEIPPWKIFLLVIIGFLSEAPEIGYDLNLNRILKRDTPKKYIYETSWITNTINNLVGFGGLISIGLRSTFYGTKKDGKEFANTLSKVFLFSLSGLSFFSLISFLLVLFKLPDPYVNQYWIWLIGGGVYFPILLLISNRKKESLLSGLHIKDGLRLLGVSILEWVGVLTSFLSVPLILGIPIKIVDVVPLFIAASVIGIVSMMPGSIGSFDIIIIMGLSALNVEKEIIVMWILLYRIFYYILPFLLGVVLFVKNLGGTFNERFSSIPRILAEEISHKLVTILLYFSGIILILSGTMPQMFTRFSLLRKLNPFRSIFISQMTLLILGYLLILIGRGISARVKKTYEFAIVIIITTMIYSLMNGFNATFQIYMLFILLMIFFSKGELYREQLVYSWEMKTIDYLLFGLFTSLYIFIGIYNRPTFQRKHRVPEFFIFPNEHVWLLGFIGILIVSFFVILFIYYLSRPKKLIGEELDEERLSNFLENHTGNSDSQLAFLGDKRIYYYQVDGEDRVMFQFRIYNDKLIIMGDPVGNSEDITPAIRELMELADKYGYKLIFYEVSKKYIMILHDFGYDFMKMGEAAEVYLPDFTTTGKKMKAERALMNRFERENYSFEVLNPPFDHDLEARLKEISDIWLDGRNERGFSLGFFNWNYLKRGPIAIVRNENKEIVAFANIMPTYNDHVGTIDLMRYNKEISSGVMDYLFINLFQYMKDNGYKVFDLGMAPLSNVGTSRRSFIQERMAYLVFNFGSKLYSFQGLRDYKDKYASNWVPKYTFYSRDSSFTYAMLQLLIVDNAPITKEKQLFIKKMLKRV